MSFRLASGTAAFGTATIRASAFGASPVRRLLPRRVQIARGRDLGEHGPLLEPLGLDELVGAAQLMEPPEQLGALNETAADRVAEERASERVWVVAVDTNADGDLAGEKLLRDYHVNFDSFGLVSDSAPESRTLMAWAVNVRQDEDFLGAAKAPVAEFHFDDGAHGSHCAGIAAGHDVSGQGGMDGGAPGAFVVSLKLGDNRLAGGATRTSSMRKCYEYAAEFEEKWGIPVVINMSFGIDSVEEGEDAMGMVDVTMEIDGKSHKGRGVSTDIIESSIRACLDALNRAQ